jgi:hypothetical protein
MNYPAPNLETMVREYKSADAFNSDARKLAGEGWGVQSSTELSRPPGCARCCTLGIFAAVMKPKPVIVVTYSRHKPQ